MSRVAGRRLKYSELAGKSDSLHIPDTGTGAEAIVSFSCLSGCGSLRSVGVSWFAVLRAASLGD